MADARAVAIYLREKHRLQELIAAQEEIVEGDLFWQVPPYQLEAAQKKLALLRSELAELTPRAGRQ